ncbi:hypothetical protein C7967_11557 [Thalassospira sp. 11-3]|nr:hypothetical protein C7967_11557 [Thalassospira sp. 11-3]
MAQIRIKSEIKTVNWSANLRPRVGAMIQHNGYYWINNTGINSEPAVGEDWSKAGATDAGSNSGLITLEDYPGYVIDKQGKANTSMAQSGDIFMGANPSYFDGDYIIAKVKNDNPASESDFNEPGIRTVL